MPADLRGLGYLTVAEAADRLGISARGVRFLVAKGVVQACRVGPAWIVPEAEVERVALERPKRGNPEWR